MFRRIVVPGRLAPFLIGPTGGELSVTPQFRLRHHKFRYRPGPWGGNTAHIQVDWVVD